jgi:hypothetical protein
MEQKHREELAKDLCMHPMQFMKLMDPDPIEDPYQKSPDGQGTAGGRRQTFAGNIFEILVWEGIVSDSSIRSYLNQKYGVTW